MFTRIARNRHLLPSASAVAVLALSAYACSFDSQMNDQQNFAVYAQSPNRVVETLTSVLVGRSELSADLAGQLGGGLLTAIREQREAQLNSQSVNVDRGGLGRLVPEEYRRFIGDEGGRYVLSITLEPAADGGLRVTVNPTIIATVRGGEGPLGGRPLPSNGALESAVLQSISERLGG